MLDLAGVGRSRAYLPQPPAHAFGLWLLAFFITSLGVLAVPLDSDTATELISVRRWFEQGTSLGINSSLPGVTHGSSVLRIYELCRWLHVPLAWTQFLFAAAFAGGVAIIAHTVRSLSDRPLAWAEVAIVFLVAVLSFNVGRLWNMSLTPLFTAMFTVALLQWIYTGAVRSIVWMAFALGMATECQIGSLVVLPAVTVLLAASPERPRLSEWILAFGAAVVGPAVLSFSIWLRNIRVLTDRYGLLILAAISTLGLVILLGRMFRPAWARLSASQRLYSAIAVVTASVWTFRFIGEMIFGLSLGGGRIESILWGLHALILVFGVRFLMRVASPAATGLVHAIIIMLALCVWLGVRVMPELPMLFPHIGQPSPWSLADMPILAAALKDRHLGWDAADAHLWTTEPSLVLGYLKAELDPETPFNIDAMDDLLILKTSARILDRPLPTGWTSFPLSTFTVALVHPFHSQLALGQVELELETTQTPLRREIMARGTSVEPARLRYSQAGPSPAVWDESGNTFHMRLHLPRKSEAISSADSFLLVPTGNEMNWWFAEQGASSASHPACHAAEIGDEAAQLEGTSRDFVFLPSLVEFAHEDEALINRVFADLVSACQAGRQLQSH